MKIDRRTLLIGGGAGVGLIVAFSLWPRHWPSDLPVANEEQAFGSFIKIARDGKVTVAVPQAETGQGIWTALPQVVADELGAAWETVAVEPAPLNGKYDNPLVGDGGLRITAGSTSVRAFEQPLREAAATARALLIGAAADRWTVDPSTCDSADGFVICGVRTATFGELAEEAAARGWPSSAPLRPPGGSRARVGPIQRLDGPAKSDGSWRFASDVRLPGMLFASARIAPPGGKLKNFSRDAIAKVPGVRHVGARDGWIAVAADNWWAAERALKAADPVFSGTRSGADPRLLFERAFVRNHARAWFSRGDYGAATRGSRPLAATYYAAPSYHYALEPFAATARVEGDRAEIWAASLAPEAELGAMEKSTGLSGIAFYPMPAGEPGGRAIAAEAVPIAVHLARETRHPVQLCLSQSVGQNHALPSGGAMARLAALPGAGGITAAWSLRLAAGPGFGAWLAALAGDEAPAELGQPDLEGSVPPYAIADVSVEKMPVHLPGGAGYMRGSPERELAFFTESFIDELARAAGIEPLSFRMSMLGNNGRLARCLQAAARLAQWDGGGRGSTMGLAGASAFGSHIGLVASASIDENQRVKVHKLFAAVDCGRIINPGLVEQQVSAGLNWGLAQATAAPPEWIAGMPRARSIGGIALPRFGDAPEIGVTIIASSEAPGGISGLGCVPVAPAVANAIFAGTGKRMRSLPFDAMAVA